MTEQDFRRINWEKGEGLVPAIVQDTVTGRVLMLGYMNREALERTLNSRQVTFWSRSQSRLWIKGESSGNRLVLDSVVLDCDQDALLVRASPGGPTCHFGTLSCFGDQAPGTTAEFLFYLEALIRARKQKLPENSYTTKLFEAGVYQIARKLGEEAIETIMSVGESRERTIEEAGDLIYHLLVFLTEREVGLEEVIGELAGRHRKSAPGQ